MKVQDQRVYFLRLYQSAVKPFLPKGFSVKLEVETIATFVEVKNSEGILAGRIPLATCFGPSVNEDTMAKLILLSAGVVVS